MRLYKNAFGEEWDLDDPTTYHYLSDNIRLLENDVFRLYGYAKAYFKFMRPYHSINFVKQESQVEAFMGNFCRNRLRDSHMHNLLWFQEQVFLLEDLTENLC